MKRLLLFLTLLALSVSSYSQVSFGQFVMFPDAKLAGSMWKPQIDFVRINELDVIGIRTCADDTYYSFDADSRVLLRFADSTVVKLPIIEELDIQKDFNTQWVGSSLIDQYVTFSFYSIEEDTIYKIVVDKIPIVKIRLVFTNGDIRDYDIPKNYQKKLVDGLIFSRNQAFTTNKVRKSNETDESF